MNWEQRSAWFFTLAQDDLNLHILRMFEGMFSLDAARMCGLCVFAIYIRHLVAFYAIRLFTAQSGQFGGGVVFYMKIIKWLIDWLGFNDTTTLGGHFASYPGKREKRDRRDSRGDERREQGRKMNRNESEEKEEIKTAPPPLPPPPPPPPHTHTHTSTRTAGLAHL